MDAKLAARIREHAAQLHEQYGATVRATPELADFLSGLCQTLGEIADPAAMPELPFEYPDKLAVAKALRSIAVSFDGELVSYRMWNAGTTLAFDMCHELYLQTTANVQEVSGGVEYDTIEFVPEIPIGEEPF